MRAVRYKAIQSFVWDTVEAAAVGHRVSQAFDQFIIGLILVNVVAVVLGTIPEVHAYYGKALYDFERFSVAVFTFEYLLRFWASAADPRFAGRWTGRLRFMVTPLAVIDLLAIVPFYFPLVFADVGLAPILRLLRLAKLGRYYESLNIIRDVLRSKREELMLTGAIMGVLLVVSSTMMYFVEHNAQPEVYRSVPDTMWWAVATLTTVGYGDVTPITAFGKMLASVIALLGIGMFALPTGIMGAGFVEVMRQRRETPLCPHCGKALVSGPHWGTRGQGMSDGASGGEGIVDEVPAGGCPEAGEPDNAPGFERGGVPATTESVRARASAHGAATDGVENDGATDAELQPSP